MSERDPVETRVTDGIRDYIVSTWLSGDARGFDVDTDLQESGILDSFATLALIAYLDETFKTRLEPSEVSTESFRTVRTVAKLVVDKLAQDQAK